MSLRLAQRLAARAEVLDPVADRVQSFARAAVQAAPKPLQNMLDGTWLGVPLHPALTDVPVGAWTTGVFLDSLDAATDSQALRNAADGALAVGVAGALPAAVTGTNDWSHLSGDSKRIGTVHALLNVGALSLNAASLALRRRGRRDLGIALAGAGWLMGAFSAHLGGQLSFGLGVRVNRTAWERPADEFEPVLDEVLLQGTQLRRVDVNGVPVVLTRAESGEPCAIAATCSHLGGPLADGAREGDTVICPWHGSRFNLCTGDVEGGPAVFPQPRYEARVREGRIELRAAEG